MKEDLELHGDRYEWLLTAFYATYIVRPPDGSAGRVREMLTCMQAFSMADFVLESLSGTQICFVLRDWVWLLLFLRGRRKLTAFFL